MKVLKNKIIKSFIGASILFSTSCTKDFNEINKNPNNPDDAPISNVFANAVVTVASRFGTSEIEYPASYVGYASRASYNDATNYATSPPSSQWTQLLSTFSTNLNLVIKKSEEEGLDNTLAAALVMKAYGTQILVDSYGPVPYFEAGQGAEGNFHPKFDSEQVIYTDLIKLLDKANDLFDNAEDATRIGSGDVLLGNDMVLWKKFGNSLQLRIAIRMSNVDETSAKTIIQKILGDPTKYPILESNADNIALIFPGEDWREPWTSASDAYVDIKIGAPIVDIMHSLKDPRLVIYAEPLNVIHDTIEDIIYIEWPEITNPEDSLHFVEKDTIIGLKIGADGEINSKINRLFVDNETGPVPFMKYAEVEFIKAEAYKRSLATGDAKTSYDNAITASLNEYEIEDADITTYLDEVTWKDDLTQLYTQKWIALFRQSWEAWAEMRRTDVPALAPAANSDKTGHNRTPFRFGYPQTEKDRNAENIPTNVNEIDTYWGYHIWWDIRSGVN